MSELLYFSLGWLFIPAIVLFAGMATKYRIWLGLSHKNTFLRVLSQLVELLTFLTLGLIFVVSVSLFFLGNVVDDRSIGLGRFFIFGGMILNIVIWALSKQHANKG